MSKSKDWLLVVQSWDNSVQLGMSNIAVVDCFKITWQYFSTYGKAGIRWANHRKSITSLFILEDLKC